MATHCLTNGFLGTGELPCCGINGATITTFNPPSGTLRRGVCVYFHGLYVSPVQFPLPVPVTDSYNAAGSGFANSLCTNLANDGWVVLAVPAQEDTYVGVPSGGIYNDVLNDSTYGARYNTSTLHVWTHIYTYIQQTYGVNWPILMAGFSLGGWRATNIAQAYASQIIGCFSHQPASVFETVRAAYTPGYQFGNLNWSGANDNSTELNTVSDPIMIGYSTGDTAVWYGGNSTVATINGATTALAAASVTDLTVSGGNTNFNASSGSQLLVTGLVGGTSQGRATYTYTGYSAGAFTGLSLIAGSGTVGVGALAVQSYIDTFITNGVAKGRAITRNQGTEVHGLGVTDSGAYYAGTATTISAINTATTLQITATQASANATANQYLTSGACAIQDTAGVWHPLTFTGTTSPNLTGVVISGSGSIAAQAPICNTGTAITGGTSFMSYPYWVSTVIDPNYPKVY
jgi:hypothetical protein